MPDEPIESNPVVAALRALDPKLVVEAKEHRGQLNIWVRPERITMTCGLLKHEQGYQRLSFITAADWHPVEPRFELVYSIHSFDRNNWLRLKCRLAGEAPEVDSVTSVWQAANWYEREVFDLFGVRFRNHPDLRRILLPEDWQGHPLRKDYSVSGVR